MTDASSRSTGEPPSPPARLHVAPRRRMGGTSNDRRSASSVRNR